MAAGVGDMCNFSRPRSYVPLLVILSVSLLPQSRAAWDCGQRKIETKFLIHHGRTAKEGYYPWHAAIYHRVNGEFQYACGGSIVDNNTILTSAHCISTETKLVRANETEVHLGQTQLNSTGSNVQVHSVARLIVHPQFRPENVSNDIALIRLSQNITTTKYVQPVCIWHSGDGQESIVGTNGTIVGFGHTEEHHIANHLREALVEVVDWWTCVQSDRRVFGIHLTQDMICAKGAQNISACSGDSGGGMVFEGDGGRWFVRGLVSFIPLNTESTCDVTKHTVFTDVARYRQWMAQYVDPVAMSFGSESNVDHSPKLQLLNLDACGTGAHHPWMGLIEMHRVNNRVASNCQVLLISRWYAVGPAHCFGTDRGYQTILLGGKRYDPDCNEQRRKYCPQRRPIEAVIINPKYNMTTFEHDIALIELGAPADVAKPHVHPVCLPVVSHLRSRRPASVSVSAFAFDSETLQSITTRTPHYRNASECQAEYSSYGFAIKMDGTKHCTDRGERQTLQGSAMLSLQAFRGRERHFLRGFDLFGVRAFFKLQTVVFVNTDFYLAWILYHMKDKLLSETPLNQSQSTPHVKMDVLDSETCGTITNPEYRFPWLGTLEGVQEKRELRPFQLATIVSEWYAVSHTIQAPSARLTIILGDIETLYNASCIERHGTKLCNPVVQRIQIERIVNHPQYVPEELDNDIALIEFASPADITKSNVRPICLPLANLQPSSKPVTLTLATITKLRYNTYVTSRNMRLITPEVCHHSLAAAGLIYKEVYTSLCALFEHDEGCYQLNEGASLQALQAHNNRKRYFLRGFPYTYHVCDTTIPYLFDDIGKHIDWISGNMLSNVTHLPVKKEEIIRNALMISHKSLPQQTSKLRLLDFQRCGVWLDINESTMAMFGSFPWIGLLQVGSNETVVCLVTLITEWHAVAPAHCFEDTPPSRYVVRFGTSKSQTNQNGEAFDGGASVQMIRVQRIVKHRDYEHSRFRSNIALIRFATRVDTTKPSFVLPVCLPVMDLFLHYDPTEMIAAIYPTTSNSISSYSKSLYENDRCEQTIRRRNIVKDIQLDSTAMCTLRDETVTEDACSEVAPGASLQTLHKLAGTNQYFLRGLLVYRGEDCKLGVPEVYTDVDYFVYWILQEIENNLSEQMTQK